MTGATPPEFVNQYGDRRLLAGDAHHGIDVAAQRADELDLMAVAHIRERVRCGPVLAADLGCGSGGQVARMLEAGASVLAVDISDQTSAIAKLGPGAFFRQLDIRNLAKPGIWESPTIFDVIVCQRTLHYLRHAEALAVLKCLWSGFTRPGSTIYLSASGIGSELADGYTGRGFPLAERYAPLADAMREKHAIHGPVCLYDAVELAETVRAAGFDVFHVAVSAFGNAKVAARR